MSLLYRPHRNKKSELVTELFYKLHDPSAIYFARYFTDPFIVTDEFIEEKVVRKTTAELVNLIEEDDGFWWTVRKRFRISTYRKRKAHGKGDVTLIPLVDVTGLIAPYDLGLLDLEAEELLNVILCIMLREGQLLSAKIIRMLALDGMTDNEIKCELKTKPATAAKAINRARKHFRRVLATLL